MNKKLSNISLKNAAVLAVKATAAAVILSSSIFFDAVPCIAAASMTETSSTVYAKAGSDTDNDDASELSVTGEYSKAASAHAFKTGKDWFPLPKYSDREGWAALSAKDSAAIVRRAESFIDYRWQVVPATGYLKYERTGDRKAMENPQGGNRAALIALMNGELVEGKGRFIDQLIDGAWMATEQTSWVLSAHTKNQRSHRCLPDSREHYIDLGSARYGAIMSLIYHFFKEEFDKADPSISYAIEKSIRRNILDPYLDIRERKAQFWLGYYTDFLNNWTTWCNADVALCFLLVEKDQSRLDAALLQSAESMDRWLAHIQDDGGCEEGPGYWDAAPGKFYDYLQIMYDASEGEFNLFGNDRVRRMGEFASRAYIGNGYVVNFADADPTIGSNFTETVWRYGNAIGSREMKNYALYTMADTKNLSFKGPYMNNGDGYRAIQCLRFNGAMGKELDSLRFILNDAAKVAANNAEAKKAAHNNDANAVAKKAAHGEAGVAKEKAMSKILHDLRKDVPSGTWYQGTEVCYMRNSSEWFLGTKGGYNDESHNHNDIGTCILYIRNIPVLIDAGVGTYSRKTFSSERYTIWSMRGEWHNIPCINGVAQEHGEDYRACEASCKIDQCTMSLNLVKAYPDSADVDSWKRAYTLSTKGQPKMTVTDSFTLKSRKAADVEHFLVQGNVWLAGDTLILADGKEYTVKKNEAVIGCSSSRGTGGSVYVRMTYSESLKASVDIKVLDDNRFVKNWGDTLKRINLTSSDNAPIKGKYSIVFTELSL